MNFKKLAALALLFVICDGAIAASAFNTRAGKGSPLTNAEIDANWTALGRRQNLIINGGFTVNQRGYVSAATLASTNFGHDRWKAGSGGGDYSFTQLASDTTITIAANKTLIQVIEDKHVQATTYILAWTGTAQCRYAVNSATPAGSYAASPVSISGQTVGTTMSIECGNGASSGTLGKVQLEEGTLSTPFIYRTYADELALCRRYAQPLPVTAGQFIALGLKYATSFVDTPFFFPAMRAAPTLVNQAGTAITWNAGAPGANQASAYDPVAAGYTTITGALTITLQSASTTNGVLRYSAATSFSGGATSVITGLHQTNPYMLSSEL